jgi:8-oxo-dGTP pyrophosphatase MutT (NUDIX family)
MSVTQTLAQNVLPRLFFRTHSAWLRLRRPLTLGARIAIRDEGGAFLLVRHTYRPGWFLPGGGVHKWESFEQCAIREAREEAGVEVTALDALFGLYTNFTAERCDHVALFVARDWRDAGFRRSLEIAEARFFPFDDLPDTTTPAMRRRIDEIVGRRPRDSFW